MKIAIRLPLLIVGCSLIPATAVGFAGYFLAQQEIHAAIESKLVAVRDSRHSTFKRYMEIIDDDLRVISANEQLKQATVTLTREYERLDETGKKALRAVYTPETPNGPVDAIDSDDAARITWYVEAHRRFHPWLDVIREVRGYYDVFLVSANGDLVYSAAKETDFATNLLTGRWRRTGLGRVARGGLSPQPTPNQLYADFEPYAPSNGQPAGFVATPIKEEGVTIGVLVFQMPHDQINKIMLETSGLGRTGETYLVGADYLMRTNSRFSKESSVLKQKVSTSSVLNGLAGNKGLEIIEGYRGNSVLSAYQSINFKGIRWVILSEMDIDEVSLPIVDMRQTMGLLGLLTASIVAMVGLIMAIGLTQPLTRLSETFQRFGATRAVETVPYLDRRDEIGDVARVFEAVRTRISQIDDDF